MLDSALTSTPPQLTEAQAAETAMQYWDIKSCARLLTAERDQNFLIEAEDRQRYVLKLTNPGEDRMVSNLQTVALLHIAARDSSLPVPKLLPAMDGAFEVFAPLPDGRESMVRMMTFLSGTPLYKANVTVQMAGNVGSALGRLDIALADFEHPARDHDFLWDIRRLAGLDPLLKHIECEETRRMAGKLLDAFCKDTVPQLTDLPQQVIHNDFNLYNVFGADNAVTGIIDFGDMIGAQRVIDAATLCAYLIEDTDEPLRLARAAMDKYVEINPLTSVEMSILPQLVIARRLLAILITNWHATLFPHNAAYILRNEPQARAVLLRMESLEPNLSQFFWENANA